MNRSLEMSERGLTINGEFSNQDFNNDQMAIPTQADTDSGLSMHQAGLMKG